MRKVKSYELRVKSGGFTVLRSYGLTVFLLLACCLVYGQTSTREKPYSWENGREEVTISSIPIITMPNLDLETLRLEDSQNDYYGVGPFRFGYSDNVNLTLTNSGSWKTTSDGGKLWTLRIYSPDAISLNLLYDNFWLPDGAKFFIYSEDKKQHLGAFTSHNNKGSRDNNTGFATAFLFTNSIVLEYYEPDSTCNTGIISICNVISGYRYADEMLPDPNPCFMGINCASNLSDVKDAVALMIMGEYACSGSLLNSTANDNRPLFLSADHCFDNSVPPSSTWIFYWNYETERCDNSDGNIDPNKSTTGATLLARAHDTDFMLLNLDDDPVENSNVKPYYLGWDRRGVFVSSSYCIHHPRRLAKKYAYSARLTSTNIYQIEWKNEAGAIIDVSPSKTHWVVYFTGYSVGHGSSGSPLLTANYKRVIGQCHGSLMNSCPQSDTIPEIVYGRFDLSWNGNSSSERLRDWLNPINSGLTVIDGMQPIPYQCEYNLVLSGTITATNDYHAVRRITSTQIINSGTTSYKAGVSITLQSGFHAEAGSFFSAQIEECEISNAKINSPEKNSTNTPEKNYTKNTHIQTHSKAQVTLFPNPNAGTFQLETNFPLTEIAQLKITNLPGAPVYEAKTLSSNEIQWQHATDGLYFVVIILKDGTVLTQKMMVQR